MHEDPIVEEVRKHRQEWAAGFGYNIAAMAADLRKREGSGGHRLVDLSRQGVANARRRAVREERVGKAGRK